MIDTFYYNCETAGCIETGLGECVLPLDNHKNTRGSAVVIQQYMDDLQSLATASRYHKSEKLLLVEGVIRRKSCTCQEIVNSGGA